jgi:hypothetical protein
VRMPYAASGNHVTQVCARATEQPKLGVRCTCEPRAARHRSRKPVARKRLARVAGRPQHPRSSESHCNQTHSLDAKWCGKLTPYLSGFSMFRSRVSCSRTVGSTSALPVTRPGSSEERLHRGRAPSEGGFRRSLSPDTLSCRSLP